MRLNLDRALALAALSVALFSGAVSTYTGIVSSSNIQATPTNDTGTSPLSFPASGAADNAYIAFSQEDWDGVLRIGPDDDESPSWCNGLTGASDTLAYCGTDGNLFLEIGDTNGGISGVVTHGGAQFVSDGGFVYSGTVACSNKAIFLAQSSPLTITQGTGAPTCSSAAGSLYLRSDGSPGARIYVSQGGTTWTAIPGV